LPENAQASQWQGLLRSAIRAIDALTTEPEWSWGGGTALSTQLDHRVSYDIDLFIDSAGALRQLSPNRNPVSRELTDRWQEPGHYLKLELEEGEIDFLVAAARTPEPTRPFEFEGRIIRRETPAEVLAKKLHFRGSKMLARDVFDLAATRELDPDQFESAVKHAAQGARRAADELRRRAKRIAKEMPLAVNPTPTGARFVDIDPLEIAAVLLEIASGDDP